MKKSHLNHEDMADFFAEFYLLRQSEISEREALQLMAEGPNKKAVQSFLSILIAAPNLIQGLKQFPNFVPEYIIALLTQATKNNTDIQVLNDIAEHLNALSLTDNGISLRQQLTEALIYPVSVILVASLLATIMLIFVVPVFAELFKDMGAELPALTRLFVECANYLPYGIILLILLAVILISYLNTAYSAEFKSKLLLSLPIIGRISACIESAIIINTLYLLYNHQFSLTEALCLSATATKNTIIKSAIIESADCVKNRQSWVNRLKTMQIFSAKTLRLLTIFEKTQQLVILKTLTQSYHKQIYKQIAPSLRLLNVIVLIGCWLFVGIMIIALYLPIFQIGAAIG